MLRNVMTNQRSVTQQPTFRRHPRKQKKRLTNQIDIFYETAALKRKFTLPILMIFRLIFQTHFKAKAFELLSAQQQETRKLFME